MDVLITFMLIFGFISGIENILHLKQGKIIGRYLKSREGRVFKSFQGIPYAKPPVGDLRFKVNFIYYLENCIVFFKMLRNLGNVTFKSLLGF